jgi:deoxyribodipyrimidine photo-lyase
LIDQSGANQVVAPAHADPDQQRLLAGLALTVVHCGDNHLLSEQTHRLLPGKLQGRFTPFFHAVKHGPLQAPAPAQERVAQQTIDRPALVEPVDVPAAPVPDLPLPVTPQAVDDWLEDYLWQQQAVLHYKQTRNELMGEFSSSRLSAALALGTVSVRRLNAQLQAFECRVQSNASTAALRYEWFWREYFQWLGGRQGDALYQAPVPPLTDEQQDRLHRWCRAQTGVAIVDAAMTELQQTGFLSNRARQWAASCLVHDLAVPWQYGAAWFEHNLIDFDPNSNTGNWAYIAGGNAVSHKPHAFDLGWQAERYDPQGHYRRLWLG